VVVAFLSLLSAAEYESIEEPAQKKKTISKYARNHTALGHQGE